PEPRPVRPVLEPGKQLGDDIAGAGQSEAAQERTPRLEQAEADPRAKPLLHLRHEMTDPVRDAVRDRLLAHPDLAGEEVVSPEPRPAPATDMRDEVAMDLGLDALQPRHVLGALRPERIEQALVLAGGMDAALDAVPRDEIVQAERGMDDPDRADDRAAVDPDLVGGRGKPVSPRSGDILTEGKHRDLLLVGEAADARGDQARLGGTPPGRIHDQRHRLR